MHTCTSPSPFLFKPLSVRGSKVASALSPLSQFACCAMPRRGRRPKADSSASGAEDDTGADAPAKASAEAAKGGPETGEGSVALRELVDGLAAKLDIPLPARGAGDGTSSSVVKAEAAELEGVLQQLLTRSAGLRAAAGTALERFEPSGSADPSSSSAYVEVKVQLLLGYLISLVYYLLLKARGVPVSGHPVVPRLLWIRTLLEKLRPIDQRLQYQIGKLLQWADGKKSVSASDEDLHNLRPGELVATVEEEEEEGAEDEAAAVAPDTYRPPKVAQMEYTGDHVSMKERAERELERKKARLDRSEFMRSLREEFTDAPTEIHGARMSTKAEKAARMMEEQRQYEEDNLMRLRVSKKEAKVRQRVMRQGRATGSGVATLDDITVDFNDVARIAGGGGRGAGRKRRAGSALEEYQAASERVQRARGVMASALDASLSSGPTGKNRGAHPVAVGKKRRR